MKITFLGTSAAETIPLPYCECPTCVHARENKGKNIRKRSSYLINDDLLVDMSPDLFVACAEHDVHLLNVKHTLITHSHPDHIDIKNLIMRSKNLHHQTILPQLNFVAPPSVMMLLSNSNLKDSDMGLVRQPILPYESVKLSPYNIKAIKANHYNAIGDSVNYLIDDGEKKILIASDTSHYGENTWKHLNDLKLDMLIIEATEGVNPSKGNHLNIKGVYQKINRMKEQQTITRKTIIYATHFGHLHCPPHEKLSELLQDIDINCAYDGLNLEI